MIKIVLPLLFLLVSCSSSKKEGLSEVESLYQDAKESIEDERYLNAVETLKKIRDEFPYSKYAALSNLQLANVYFLQEDFESAYSQYSVFRDLYPTHEEIEFVIYRQGESLYQAMPSTIDRDLSRAPEAIKHFQELLKSYPRSKYQTQAKDGIERTRGKLLEREDYIGNFYFIRDFYLQAYRRYQGLRIKFPSSRLDDKALYRMIVSLKSMDEKEKESVQENLESLKGILREAHPDSPYTRKLD